MGMLNAIVLPHRASPAKILYKTREVSFSCPVDIIRGEIHFA